ncbi:hypothetical protein [Georgenia sp. Marseille-Q6866]
MPSNAALAITGILAALVGGGAGVLIAGATIEPETIVETKTETVTETVETVPEACLTALEEAERAFDLAEDYGDVYQEFRDITTEALQAAFDRDADALDAVSEDVQANNADGERIQGDLFNIDFNRHADTCRAAG